jgi:hypothetical protein
MSSYSDHCDLQFRFGPDAQLSPGGSGRKTKIQLQPDVCANVPYGGVSVPGNL